MQAILDAARDREYQKQKFAAALKGHKLDDPRDKNSEAPSFDDIKRRAQAKAAGMSEEAIEFGEVGFAVIEDED